MSMAWNSNPALARLGDMLTAGLPIAAAAMMFLSLAVLLFRYFAEPWYPGLTLRGLIERLAADRAGEPEPLCEDIPRRMRAERVRLDAKGQIRIAAGVLILFVLSRLIVFGVAAWGLWRQGDLSRVLSDPESIWSRWDAPHYLGLIENWYVNEGDPRFHIVFFPLYPLIGRVLMPLFGGNAFWTAMALSNACLAGSGWALYHIVNLQKGERAAWRAVKFLMFCPLSVFFSVPYTESLFLMLSLFAVLLARRRMFLAAAVVGALSAATRLLGLLVAAAIFLEMLKSVAGRGLWPARKGRFTAALVRCVLTCALVAAGFGAYLFLNWKVTGNPWQFEIYQREHWSQQMGTLWDTMRYTVRNIFTYDDPFWINGTWIPQAAAMTLAIALLVGSSATIYPGDGAYAWLYLFAALSPTWLLSGPRYIAAMYVLYPMLSALSSRKWANAILTALTFAGLVVCSYMYAVTGNLL